MRANGKKHAEACHKTICSGTILMLLMKIPSGRSGVAIRLRDWSLIMLESSWEMICDMKMEG